MRDPYLEVTYRHGKPFAAYYHLPREETDQVIETRRAGHGMVIDFASADRPIGIEITAPTQLTLADFNQLLESLGLPCATHNDLAPLHAA